MSIRWWSCFTVWAFVFTFGMLWLIDRVTTVHVSAGY